MKEQDIRPKNLEIECDRLRLEDIKNFFADQKKFKKVNCPACNSADHQFNFKKNIFRFCRCNKCGTLFVNPRPNQKQLADYYSKSKGIAFWSKYIFPKSEKVRIKKIFIPRTKLVANVLKKYYHLPVETLLEVGAGDGFFLRLARDFKIAKRILAIEPSKKAAEKCRALGFEVFENMVEDVELKSKADVIVNFELIEHLFNPRGFIKSCGKNLKNKGILILTTPNIMGFDLSVLGSLSDNIMGPSHLNYFNPDSLKKLLNNEDFEVLEILTPGKLDVDIIKNKIESGFLDSESLPFFGRLIKKNHDSFNENLQKFLQDNKLSSNMMVIARKKS